MCRNIKMLANFEPPATEDEIRAALRKGTCDFKLHPVFCGSALKYVGVQRLLDLMGHAVPAIVNGHCAVLKGQVRRANGGLYYRSSAEFGEAVEALRSADADRRALGAQGLAYVEREYRWPTVMARVEALLEQARQRRHPSAFSPPSPPSPPFRRARR